MALEYPQGYYHTEVSNRVLYYLQGQFGSKDRREGGTEAAKLEKTK